jgi:DNA-binding LytR/AlgR family response regulator
MNCIIVDDDPMSCKILETYVNKSPSLGLTGIFGDSVSARNSLMSKSDVDLIFLDIEMPEMDGFDFLSSLQNPPSIIVVSASENHAFKAFDFNVVDYLLKPVSYSRFCKAVEKMMRMSTGRSTPSAAGEEEIFIKKASSLVRLKLKEILYIEALENYVNVMTLDEKYTIHFTMRAIESQLPSSLFIRIHRSYMVNKSAIRSISENSLVITMGNTSRTLPVGKSFREAILNDINIMMR